MGAQQSRHLLEAASTGDVQQISQLLKSVPVDITDDDGWTALHFSSWAGRAKVVEQLLNHNANIRARDKCGRMPIHLAALRGQADVLALLCDHGSPLNDVDANGSAPLHKALTQGHVEAARHLLAYGADPKQTLQDGTTALHLAAHSGSAQAVQLLVDSGVSVHAQDCDGQTPLFEAAAAGHAQAAMVLLQNGADAGHKDREGLTAADKAPPQLAAVLREPRLALEGASALLQAPAQQPAPGQQEPGSQQGGLMTRLWNGLPSLGLLRSSTSSEAGSHSQGPECATRDPSMLRTPEWPKQDTEPADPHLGSLPSAPPLPEAQANALYTASSSQSAGLGDAERSLYPSLYTSTHPGSALRPSQSQSRQTHDEGVQTGGGSLGSADGRGGQSAAASPAVKPASSLGWAVQTAAGASSAAVTALSAWLPWQENSSASSAPQQVPQQKPQAAPQSGRSTRRYGLHPGIDLEDDDDGDQSAADCLASGLQDMSLRESEAQSKRGFRQQKPTEATEGLKRAGSHSRPQGAAAASSKEANAHDADPPAHLICPITQELFEDPVNCADGYTYSRAAITQWLQSGHSTSPITAIPLSSRDLQPNYHLRSDAMEWREARQG